MAVLRRTLAVAAVALLASGARAQHHGPLADVATGAANVAVGAANTRMEAASEMIDARADYNQRMYGALSGAHQAAHAGMMTFFNSLPTFGEMVTAVHAFPHRGHGGGARPMGPGYGAAPEEPEVEVDVPGVPEPEEPEEPEAPAAGCKSVVETAAGVRDLSILVEAVQAAGDDVVGALSDKEDAFTVFAPTNAAFSTLLAELEVTKEELLGNSTLLLGVLSYHVVPGAAVKAEDIKDGQEITTLLGDAATLTAKVSDGGVTLEAVGSEAKVINADVEACNAVVHVIDEVLLPVEV